MSEKNDNQPSAVVDKAETECAPGSQSAAAEKSSDQSAAAERSGDQSEGAEGSLQTAFGEEAGVPSDEMDFLSKLMAKVATITTGAEEGDQESKTKVLDSVTLEGIADYIKDGKAKNIIVMTGAGISTSAGIPDFRSPGTGLYDNLEKYNLPHPQAIFEIGYFKENPEPFFALSKELNLDKYKPTPCHYFIRLLHEKNLLHRNYTQNIDSLERLAGLPDDKMVEAHGSYHTGHCLGCRKEYTKDWMNDQISQKPITACTECDGVVKPDVVFFGESLPARFVNNIQKDFKTCDLLLIMGTSLTVQPFASLVDRVNDQCPRLLINKDKCGQSDPLMMFMGFGRGLEFDSPNNYRDVAYEGECDEGCFKLAELLGWKDELKAMIKKGHAKIDSENEEKQVQKNDQAAKPKESSSL